MNLEASTGEVKVLPLIVGTAGERSGALGQLPLLNDQMYLSWTDDADAVVEELRRPLSQDGVDFEHAGDMGAAHTDQKELDGEALARKKAALLDMARVASGMFVEDSEEREVTIALETDLDRRAAGELAHEGRARVDGDACHITVWRKV